MGKKNNKINKVVKHNMNNLDNEIYRFIVIFFIIALVVIGLYFLSKGIVSKRTSSENTVDTIEIAYDKLNVGMIFNRPYDEYYVMCCKLHINYNGDIGKFMFSNKYDQSCDC